MEFKRCSGILMPISSLPGGYGIGSLGKPARDFVDFLAGAGQTIWQILPVGPTGFADSPYQSCSAFAGNPYFIDLDLLAADGLLTQKDYANINWGSDAAKVDYSTLYEKRFAVLRKAYANFLKKRPVPGFETPYPDDWYRFQFLSSDWLPRLLPLHGHQGGQRYGGLAAVAPRPAHPRAGGTGRFPRRARRGA